jgi:hypothetical protein
MTSTNAPNQLVLRGQVGKPQISDGDERISNSDPSNQVFLAIAGATRN